MQKFPGVFGFRNNYDKGTTYIIEKRLYLSGFINRNAYILQVRVIQNICFPGGGKFMVDLVVYVFVGLVIPGLLILGIALRDKHFKHHPHHHSPHPV